MAEIPVEKKSSKLPWLLLALLVLGGLIIWLFASADDDDVMITDTAIKGDVIEEIDPIGEPVLTESELPEQLASSIAYTLADVLGDPPTYIGRNDFDSEVETPSVPTDRGFWVENDGARIFAVLIDGPREDPVDINPGQDLRIQEGMLRDASTITDIPGKPLDADTLAILEQQDVFLVVHEDDVTILN